MICSLSSSSINGIFVKGLSSVSVSVPDDSTSIFSGVWTQARINERPLNIFEFSDFFAEYVVFLPLGRPGPVKSKIHNLL